MPRVQKRRLYRSAVVVTLLAVLSAAGLLAVAGCRSDPVVVDPPPPPPPPPPQVPCPLCGELLPAGTDLSMRPILVLVDNHPSARPQAGLEDACVVFELLAEGGITRLMPVYVHARPERVGPVRSARHYFLDFALGMDALIAHAGGSPQALDEAQRLGVASLNAFGLDEYYWRESTRPMPHNLYTSIGNLLDAADAAGLRAARDAGSTGWPYMCGDPLSEELPAASAVEIRWPYNAAGYKVTMRWDPGPEDAGPGRYERYINDRPHLDQESGNQLGGRNVVVAFARFWRIPGDAEGRLDAELDGEGRALVFSDGKQDEVRWRKSDRSTPFVLVAADGRPVELPRGQTWIFVVPEQTEVTVLTE